MFACVKIIPSAGPFARIQEPAEQVSRDTANSVLLAAKYRLDTSIAPNSEDGETFKSSVSQSPGRGPVPGPGINYTGPREVFLEFVILDF